MVANISLDGNEKENVDSNEKMIISIWMEIVFTIWWTTYVRQEIDLEFKLETGLQTKKKEFYQ